MIGQAVIPEGRMNAMTEKKLYLILQSVLCVLMVLLLTVSAVSLYREGKARKAENPMEWIYTREAAGEKLKPIAPLFFCAIGMTVAGWVLAVKDDNAEKPVTDIEHNRDLIVSRVVKHSEQMKEEQQTQKMLFWGGWTLFLLCMVPIGIYLANGEHFPDGDLEKMIASLAAHILPWIILGFGCLIVAASLREKSMLRETAVAQAQIYAEKESGIQAKPKEKGRAKNQQVKRALQIIVAIAAVVFIVLGVMNGSAKAVHTKAANICTECVGLG